jgi:hypothetical protein
MMHLVDALRSTLNRAGVTDVGGDEFNICDNVRKPPRTAARIIVTRARGFRRAARL